MNILGFTTFYYRTDKTELSDDELDDIVNDLKENYDWINIDLIDFIKADNNYILTHSTSTDNDFKDNLTIIENNNKLKKAIKFEYGSYPIKFNDFIITLQDGVTLSKYKKDFITRFINLYFSNDFNKIYIDYLNHYDTEINKASKLSGLSLNKMMKYNYLDIVKDYYSDKKSFKRIWLPKITIRSKKIKEGQYKLSLTIELILINIDGIKFNPSLYSNVISKYIDFTSNIV